MIEVSNLTKNYGDFKAISDVSFGVREGEIMGFLGPNGAGKTTTMRIITGFLSPTAGTVKIDGLDIYDDSEKVKKIIGYLPEKPPLYPEMTVRSYLGFVAEIKGVPGREISGAVGTAMEKLNISEVSHKLIRKLSKGYQQRVGFAQAIVHNPKVLVLDEPTNGLDPTQIIEVRKLIKELKSSHTIILSTHILPEVSVTCSRVVVIHRGLIVAEDEISKLVSRDMKRLEVMASGTGDAEAFRKALAEVDGVKSVSVKADDNFSGALRATVDTGSNFETAPAIAQKLLSKNMKLHELKSSEISLEEIFLKLITKEDVE